MLLDSDTDSDYLLFDSDTDSDYLLFDSDTDTDTDTDTDLFTDVSSNDAFYETRKFYVILTALVSTLALTGTAVYVRFCRKKPTEDMYRV